MAQARLSVRKIREVLRLKAEARLSDREIVAACRTRAMALDDLVTETGKSLVDVALTVARLEHAGWLRETGGWFEAVDEWADLA